MAGLWKKEGTLPETNMAPENGGFQWESPFPGVYFQVRTVSFREGNYGKLYHPCHFQKKCYEILMGGISIGLVIR